MAARKPVTVADLARKAKAQTKAEPKGTPHSRREKKPRPVAAKEAYRFVSDAYSRPAAAPGRPASTTGKTGRRRRLHLVRQLKELIRLGQALATTLEKEGARGSARLLIHRVQRWLGDRVS